MFILIIPTTIKQDDIERIRANANLACLNLPWSYETSKNLRDLQVILHDAVIALNDPNAFDLVRNLRRAKSTMQAIIALEFNNKNQQVGYLMKANLVPQIARIDAMLASF